MAGKKNYLKVKSGLYLDPVHRKKIGSRIWLYMYILDQANWETGIVDYWIDNEVAEKLQIPKRTVKDQRQGLENFGYISCLVKGRRQMITIFNYLNPKTGEILNARANNESFIFVEEDQSDWDKKMSQSTNNQDKKMSQGGDSTTEWDTPLRDGESKNVPLPYNLNLNNINEPNKKVNPEIVNAFQFALGELQKQGINKADYDAYLKSLEVKYTDGETIVLSIANDYSKQLIENRYLVQLQSAMTGYLVKQANIRIEIG